jgi:hypothetical protein
VAEWLQQNFFPVIESNWATSPERDVMQAFVQADETLLQPKVGQLRCHCPSTCLTSMPVSHEMLSRLSHVHRAASLGLSGSGALADRSAAQHVHWPS